MPKVVKIIQEDERTKLLMDGGGLSKETVKKRMKIFEGFANYLEATYQQTFDEIFLL